MLRSLLFFLKLAAYWLIFFIVYRTIFLLIYTDKIPEGKSAEALMAFLYGLHLDLSTITYLIAIPLLLWAVQQFVKKNFLNRIHHFYNLALISLLTVLCISNIAMYGEWNALINYNTLFYLASPAKVFPYLTTIELVCVLIGVAVIIAVFVLLFRVLILMVLPYSTSKMPYKLIVIVVLLPVIFISMRGGTQQKPINETFSCYSEIRFLDHVSINPAWHLGHMALLAMEEMEEEKKPLP